MTCAAATAQPASAAAVEDLLGRHTGDFDVMLEHHRVRVLVAYSRTFYFLDGAHQRGLSHDAAKEFEKFVNKKFKKKTMRVTVVFVPVARDQLLPALLDGRGDLAIANLTITPERLKLVDFSEPLIRDVREIVITAPSTPKPASVEDLSGRTVHVRRSSSYYESLAALNEKLAAAGKAPVELVLADENLEDEDLLEMVDADLIPAVVVDEHKAKFWDKVFDRIVLNPDVAVRTGGEIGWAFRKNSPRLARVVNEFARANRKGTLLGNILLRRYLKDADYVVNAGAKEEVEKFESMIDLFRKYSDRYDFNWLIMAALGYQESRLDQSARSHVGAIGVMQMLPTTAADPNVGIPNIEELEPNIHAGIKYLDFIHRRYFDDPDVDKLNQWLFTFAAYNAGPAKVRRLRTEAAKSGLDPNVWFRNVEVIAAKRIGRETVQYVSNIYKYFIAYSLIVDREGARAAKGS